MKPETKILTGNDLLTDLIYSQFYRTVGSPTEAEENVALIDLAKRHGLGELAKDMIAEWKDSQGRPWYNQIKAARELSDDLQPGEIDSELSVAVHEPVSAETAAIVNDVIDTIKTIQETSEQRYNRQQAAKAEAANSQVMPVENLTLSEMVSNTRDKIKNLDASHQWNKEKLGQAS